MTWNCSACSREDKKDKAVLRLYKIKSPVLLQLEGEMWQNVKSSKRQSRKLNRCGDDSFYSLPVYMQNIYTSISCEFWSNSHFNFTLFILGFPAVSPLPTWKTYLDVGHNLVQGYAYLSPHGFHNCALYCSCLNPKTDHLSTSYGLYWLAPAIQGFRQRVFQAL